MGQRLGAESALDMHEVWVHSESDTQADGGANSNTEYDTRYATQYDTHTDYADAD